MPPITPIGVVLYAAPTVVDLLKMPGVGGIDLIEAIRTNIHRNKIQKLVRQSLRAAPGQNVLATAKEFEWLKEAVTRL